MTSVRGTRDCVRQFGWPTVECWLAWLWVQVLFAVTEQPMWREGCRGEGCIVEEMLELPLMLWNPRLECSRQGPSASGQVPSRVELQVRGSSRRCQGRVARAQAHAARRGRPTRSSVGCGVIAGVTIGPTIERWRCCPCSNCARLLSAGCMCIAAAPRPRTRRLPLSACISRRRHAVAR